MKMYRI